MALQVHTGTTNWATTDAVGTTVAVATTDRAGASFDPAVVLFFALQNSPAADGTTRNTSWTDSVGVATGTASRRCVGIQSREGATTNGSLRQRQDAVVGFRSDAGGAGGLLDLDQFGGGTNGFRYVVDEVLVDRNVAVQHIAFGGASGGVTNVAHGEVALTATTGTQDITGLGFNPADGDLLVAWLGAAAIGAQSEDDYRFSIGAATSASDDVVVSTNGDDDTTTARSATLGRSGYLVFATSLTGTGATHRVEFTSWITDGFRLNKLQFDTERVLQYVVIKGPRWAVRENLTRTTITTFQETGLAEQPRGGFVRGLVNSAEFTTDTAVAYGQGNSAVWSDDGADPPRQNVRTYTSAGGVSRKFNGYQADAVQFSHTENTIEGILSISAIGATSLTYSQDDADTSQKWFFNVIAMDGAVVGGGGTQPPRTLHQFRMRAA